MFWQRGFKLRPILASAQVDQPLPSSLLILPSTPQVKGLHTFIRNKDTPRDEFIFYSRRMIRLTIEFALSVLPFKVSISTPLATIILETNWWIYCWTLNRIRWLIRRNVCPTMVSALRRLRSSACRYSGPEKRWSRRSPRCARMCGLERFLYRTTSTLASLRWFSIFVCKLVMF